MKRINGYIECMLIILSIHIMEFIMRPFAFSIIDAKIIYVNLDILLTSLSYLLIYSAKVFVIFATVNSTSTAMSFCQSAKTFFLKLLPCAIGIRIVADIIMMTVGSLFSAITFFIEYACVYLIFLLSYKFVCLKREPLDTRQKACLIAFILISASIAAYYYIYLNKMLEVTLKLEEKYIDTSFLYEASTIDFCLQLINLCFSVFVWISIFIYYGIFKAKRIICSEYRSWATPYAKYMAWILIGFFFMRIKVLAIPHGCISDTDVSTTHHDYPTEVRVVDSYKTVEWKRQTNYTSSELVYRSSVLHLTYKNRTVSRIASETNRNEHNLELIKIENAQPYKAYRSNFYAIVYVKEDKCFTIDFDKINEYDKYDENLIEICKYLIDEGYFQAFEYSYKYIEQYDPEYINEYKQKLINNDYGQLFRADRNVIKKEYVQRFIELIR